MSLTVYTLEIAYLYAVVTRNIICKCCLDQTVALRSTEQTLTSVTRAFIITSGGSGNLCVYRIYY